MVAGAGFEVQRCKSERSSCAKVQRWETTLRVAGGSLGWQVAGWCEVGLTILGRPSGRAGMLDPTQGRRELGQHAMRSPATAQVRRY